MSFKTCRLCKIEKEINEFPISRAIGCRRSACRPCYKELIRSCKASQSTHEPRDPTIPCASTLYIRKKTAATPKWLTKDDKILISMMYRLARYLTKETGIKWAVDHIIPINGKNISGLHVPENLRVITKRENSKKSNKLL